LSVGGRRLVAELIIECFEIGGVLYLKKNLFIVAFNGATLYRPNKSQNSEPHADLLCEIVKTSHFFQDGQANESLVASSRGTKS
jgi:hypothetical protein